MAKAKTKKKTVKEIDITKPVKRNQLSLDYMIAYISANDENGKDEFKENAIVDNKYNSKNARDYFCKKYPGAVIVAEKKGFKTATDKLNEW